MKTFLVVLVLAAMAVKGQEIPGYDAFPGMGIAYGEFLSFDPTAVNEEVCTGLCSEMPRCVGLTFRTEAEKGTEALQCRFKEGVNEKKLFDKPTRISFLKVEEGGYDKFVDKGINGGEFISFAPSEVNEATCASLCSEMPKCVAFTFRIGEEGGTEASQCRFKKKVKKMIARANRNSYVKIQPK